MLLQFNRRFFTSFKSSLLNFHSKLESHRFQLTAYSIPDEELTLLPDEDHEVHSLSSSFFIYPDEFNIYKHKDASLLNSQKKDYNHLRANFLKFVLPLSTHSELRARFMRFYTQKVRLGRLMEVLDYMAGITAYSHCYCKPFSRDLTIVTLCMDQLKIFKGVSCMEDITIQSYPTCTTNSTIEIRVDVYQKNDETKKQDICSTALFLMAARDANDFKKPASLPKLNFDGEKDVDSCVLRMEMGQRMNEKRKKDSASNTLKMPPTGEESIDLHRIFMGEKVGVPMVSTSINKTLLMHYQEKNISGRVFGGYLMREALELAWNCVYLHTQSLPEYFMVDDVKFLNGVEIGSVIDFKATITGIFGQLVHVVVDTRPHGSKITTNEVHITLVVVDDISITPVYPERYVEGMMYLESKRRLDKNIKE